MSDIEARIDRLVGYAGFTILLGAHAGKVFEKIYAIIESNLSVASKTVELLGLWLIGLAFWVFITVYWVRIEPSDAKN